MSAAPDGPVLALDSSTSTGSVAVGDASGVLAAVSLGAGPGHSSSLLPAVEAAMRTAGVERGDLAAVVVAGGPGSFTGLRVAASLAKGMVQALGIPLHAFSGLLAEAAAGWGVEGPVCALFDARRRDVFAACYDFRGSREPRAGDPAVPCSLFPVPSPVLEPAALPLDELIGRLREDPPRLLVGEGARIHREELERELGARVLPAHLALPRACALLWLAFHAPALASSTDAAQWEPDYLRAAGAERIAAARSAGAEPGRG